MNKKQKTYALLVAVIIIWGAVIVQIIRYTAPDAPRIIEQKAIMFSPKPIQKAESYTIEPNYRDPFFGKLYQKPKTKKVKAKKRPEVVFPTISYDGIISSSSGKTFLISIKGIQEVVKVGRSFQGVELISGDESKIKLRYKGVTKTYSIKN